MDDFSSVKVGDRLWLHSSYYIGWVTVAAISTNAESYYPIKVVCTGPSMRYESISKHGHISELGPQCLFWAEPTVIAPPKPKQKMVRVIEDVSWSRTSIYFPMANAPDFISSGGWATFLNKPPMRMTLEWEE